MDNTRLHRITIHQKKIQHGIRIQHAGMRFIFNIIYIPQYKNLITNHIGLEHKIFDQS